MELRDYKEGDEHLIIELFELVFKQKMSLNQWLWRFRQNPAGKHMIKLMWEGEQLIGHYAVSPVIMMVDGVETLTAHSLTTMTHPDFGGRGIFKALSLALYDDLENKLGCKAIWGYPNNNSHFGFIKSLGWSNIAVIHTLGMEANQLKINENIINSKVFENFSSDHSEFVQSKLAENFPVYIDRSQAYLNWRFVEKPAVAYKKFEFEHQGKKGVIVTKVYPSNQPNKFDLNIVECFMDDYSNLHNCIDFIIKEYALEFARITVWRNLFDKDHLEFEKNGFVPVAPQTYLGARIHSRMPASFENYKNWYVAMGDSDVF
ncbi:MAG: GNAT family N-acetyltransferase [Flavobacterium sp.]